LVQSGDIRSWHKAVVEIALVSRFPDVF